MSFEISEDSLTELSTAVRKELTENILPFWKKHGRDLSTGGFYGFLGNDNVGDPGMSRSVVMTSRHLWTYSAAARTLGDKSCHESRAYLEMADYAYAALVRDFIDPVHGGVFWSVRPDGTPDVSKKQIYGEAFALYAFAEYSSALCEIRSDKVGSLKAIELAVTLYGLLESHARDRILGGYAEARARDWSPTSDLKLSGKDIDCDKSMNTNLHVMEALASLHRAIGVIYASCLVPEGAVDLRRRVAESLSSLIKVTVSKILGSDNHLDLYFNPDWSSVGDIISYGHDIEASWLLWEAVAELESGFDKTAETGSKSSSVLNANVGLKAEIKAIVIKMAETTLDEGTEPEKMGTAPEIRAIMNEFHDGHKDPTRVWWCQAEALVGFFNAWQLTGKQKFLDAVLAEWKWIILYQIDRKNGDWFAAVRPDGTPDLNEPKGGNWKASYHNGRCCMELLRRIRDSA